jgi:hypothetical protein
MPRTTLTKKQTLGQFGTYGADLADLPMTAADVANKNQFVFRPGDIVIAHNTGASPYTVTITSIASTRNNRSGDIGPYTMQAGEYAVIGPFSDQDGFLQSDGYIYLEASNASVKFGVVQP